MNLPPEIKEGDPLPGAAWWAALFGYLKSARVGVARDSGLSLIEGPDGTVIGFSGGSDSFDAYTTSVVAARTTNTLGTGSAKFCVPGGTSGRVLTDMGLPPITVHNNTGSSIPSGSYCYVKKIGNLWRVWEADCKNTTSPGAPAAKPTRTT